jgi:Mg-chelatase subunit ChlD
MTDSSTRAEHAHLWFLLDRSGSMEAVRWAVVEGLASFLQEQHAADPEARFTLTQFDDQDPQEVVIDGKVLADVAPLTSEGYRPRGSTPLYDAIGMLVERVDAHVADGGHDADQVVVVLTDGLENASRRFTQRQVFTTITDRRERGWTFVFLGANQDAYEAGGAMGVAVGNTANWDATDRGARHAMAATSTAAAKKLRSTRAARQATREQFFEDDDSPRDDSSSGSSGS